MNPVNIWSKEDQANIVAQGNNRPTSKVLNRIQHLPEADCRHQPSALPQIKRLAVGDSSHAVPVSKSLREKEVTVIVFSIAYTFMFRLMVFHSETSWTAPHK